MKRITVLLFAFAMTFLESFSQNLAINADGTPPNANAILDIKSNNKGIMIPRMNTAARLAIPPTIGLLVYDTDTESFWYNTGSQWKSIISDIISLFTNFWRLNGNAGTDSSNFLGTLDNKPLRIRVRNIPSGLIDDSTGNTYWGFRI
jgi:hypothetical protein